MAREKFIPRPDKSLPFPLKVAFYLNLILDNTHGPAEAIRNYQEEKPKKVTIFPGNKP